MANPTPPTSPPEPESAPEKKCAPEGVPEADLATALGVARADLKKLRGQLTQGVHWSGGEGRPVLITLAGQQCLQELLARADAGTPVDAAVAAIRRVEYHTLIVTRIGGARVLVAKKDGDDPGAVPLRILVRSTVNFIVGMAVPQCQASTTTPGVFYFHGRLPRWRGRF